MSYTDILELLSSAPYFTSQNLSLKIKGNTRYWIRKLVKEGLLVSLKKGTYISPYYLTTVVKDPLERECYFEYLANVMRKPSYVSLEYMLSKYGAIPEAVFSITSVTTKSTRIYSSDLKNFIYKSISSDLFSGYKEETFKDKTIFVAKRSKALFDFIYFKDFSDRDALKEFLEESARINWDVFDFQDLVEFREYVGNTDYLKMQQVLGLIEEKKLIC